jgi:hypothetical protein
MKNRKPLPTRKHITQQVDGVQRMEHRSNFVLLAVVHTAVAVHVRLHLPRLAPDVAQ